jgi:hypothetical protein
MHTSGSLVFSAEKYLRNISKSRQVIPRIIGVGIAHRRISYFIRNKNVFGKTGWSFESAILLDIYDSASK